MLVYAQDLFQADPNTNPSTSNAATNPSGGVNPLGFDLFAYLSDPSSLQGFILQLNRFTIAWCIFYSILFVLDFFHMRMYHSDGEVPKMMLGEGSIRRALGLWWSYLICWVFLLLYFLFPIVGIVTIAVYFLKLLSIDLPNIFDLIHNHVGFGGPTQLFKNVTNPLKKLLHGEFLKSKPKKK